MIVSQLLIWTAAEAASVRRWGYIGCGSVAERKSSPPAFRRPGRSDVVGVFRRNSSLANDYAERHGVPRWFESAAVLVEAVDAVYVATPPGTHLEYARLAAKRRRPCVVEKPAARTYPESAALAAAFEATETPLFVAYYRRAWPRHLRLRRLVAALGRVERVAYHFRRRRVKRRRGWRFEARLSGGGLFVDIGSHALDLFDFLLGPLLDARGGADGPGRPYVETRVWLEAGLGDGGRLRATWDFDAKDDAHGLVIVGSNATLEVPDLLGGKVTRLIGTNGVVLAEFTDAVPDPAHGLFVDAVLEALDRGDRGTSSVAAALRTAAVIDRLLDEYWGGRAASPTFAFAS